MNPKTPKITHHFTVKEYGKATNGVVFVFAAWRIPPALYALLVRRLIVPKGYHCVFYTPRSRLIAVGTQYSEIVEAARTAVTDVQERIRVSKDNRTDLSFTTFGISFGTLFAMEAAKRCPEIKRAILVSPFGDFEEHVLEWSRHRLFGKILNSQTTSRTQSGRVLNQVGTTKNVELLQGKRVLICYSSKDDILHTNIASGLVKELIEKGINTEVHQVSGGHIPGVVKSLLDDKKFNKFLSS